jgi:hypothetical protein
MSDRAADALAQYREQEAALRAVRRACSPQDAILERMAQLWELLTPEQRQLLDDEGPTCDVEAT